MSPSLEAALPTPSSDSLFSPERRALSIGAVGLCSMIAFEAIGVAAGMPAVAAALDGVPLYALAFSGTLAGSVVAMVWAGGDCDRHGPMRSMAGGIALFALGLLMAGLAGSMATLVIGRIVQGFGVGALGVALYVAVARTLPSELHPRLFALFSTAWVVPAIVGPAISGWIVETLGWRWLFLGIAVLLLPTAALILPPLRGGQRREAAPAPDRRPLCWAVLASVACVSLTMSAAAGTAATLVVIASLIAIAFASYQLLPEGSLRLARGLPTVITLRALNSAAFFLCEAFVPLWLHQQCGWSITAAGLALTGGALSWSLGSQLQSRIRDDRKRLSWLHRGSALLFAGIAACGFTVFATLPGWLMLVAWTLVGLGMGLAYPMLGVLTLKLAPPDQQGRYSSALQLGAALATSAALSAGGLLFALLLAGTPVLAFTAVFALATLLAAVAWTGSSRVSAR